ncbi:hypothetical protein ACPA9J_27705 [Pseudomonas aeruginosa]
MKRAKVGPAGNGVLLARPAAPSSPDAKPLRRGHQRPLGTDPGVAALPDAAYSLRPMTEAERSAAQSREKSRRYRGGYLRIVVKGR